jgi:hypothetical protein
VSKEGGAVFLLISSQSDHNSGISIDACSMSFLFLDFPPLVLKLLAAVGAGSSKELGHNTLGDISIFHKSRAIPLTGLGQFSRASADLLVLTRRSIFSANPLEAYFDE